MLHSKSIKWLIVALMCVFVSACVSTQKANKSVSNKEKAALNLKMGGRYLEMNMLETAKEKIELAISLDSKNAKAYNTLGVLYERLNQYDMAGKQYKKAMRLDEENASILNNYGRFLCEKEDYQAGIALLKKAIIMPFNHRKWFAYTNIGRCELGKGDLAAAERNFRQALQDNKNYSPALSEMQKISYKAKKYMSARAFLERYLAVTRHSAETLWYAVQTERALGNKAMSEKYREQLLMSFPSSKESEQVKTAIR
ncbi:MAG: type IV pilus biogenesis/stability protein PilW [Methylococcaceae bacterium]|nr:type IV pilus biogenesis/stability protein PilW [Methylococcaceae bacterium]